MFLLTQTLASGIKIAYLALPSTPLPALVCLLEAVTWVCVYVLGCAWLGGFTEERFQPLEIANVP